jgi:hypothetical protein
MKTDVTTDVPTSVDFLLTLCTVCVSNTNPPPRLPHPLTILYSLATYSSRNRENGNSYAQKRVSLLVMSFKFHSNCHLVVLPCCVCVRSRDDVTFLGPSDTIPAASLIQMHRASSARRQDLYYSTKQMQGGTHHHSPLCGSKRELVCRQQPAWGALPRSQCHGGKQTT